jgi:hypothetical protein
MILKLHNYKEINNEINDIMLGIIISYKNKKLCDKSCEIGDECPWEYTCEKDEHGDIDFFVDEYKKNKSFYLNKLKEKFNLKDYAQAIYINVPDSLNEIIINDANSNILLFTGEKEIKGGFNPIYEGKNFLCSGDGYIRFSRLNVNNLGYNVLETPDIIIEMLQKGKNTDNIISANDLGYYYDFTQLTYVKKGE